MNIGLIIRYYKRIYREVSALSAQTGVNRYCHLVDYLAAFARHGAHIDQYTTGKFWTYSNAKRAKCLTHYRRLALEKKYNSRADIHYFDSKSEFNRLYSDFIHRDWLWLPEASFDDFKSLLLKHKSLIVKPTNGQQGKGIRKIDLAAMSDEQLRRCFDELVREDVIVEEIIVQHPAMVFGNKSVNTIRVLTACRPDGTSRVMKTFLRAGVGDSLVDNTATGGYYYEVGVDEGFVTSGGTSKSGDLKFVHPQTDIVMLGYKVPHWDKVIEMCLEAARRVPRVALVGWDVAITRDGVQLIEGNNSSDYIGYEFVGSNGYYEKIKNFMEGKD